MNERTMQFRVGVMILATILIALIVVLLPLESSPLLLHRSDTIYIKFNEAPGVTRGTPVRRAGIRIGQVQDVQLAKDDSGVIVTAQIDRDRRPYSDELCKVTSPPLLGDTSLDIVKNPDFHGEKTLIEDGGTLPAQATRDTLGSIAGLQGEAERTMAVLNSTGHNIDKLVNRVDRLVETNEKGITSMIGEARETMDLLRKTLNDGNKILGDPELQAQIRQAISKMPDTLEKTRGAAERVEKTFASLEHDMKDLEGLTKALGKYGPDAVEELDKTMNNFRDLTGSLLQFTQTLNDPQYSLGALLHDKELYPRVNHIAKNIDELTRELKPLLNDARVFTDKIARHPELLGVRGAIKKDVGLKDSPTSDGAETEVPENSRWPIGGSGRWSVGR